MSVGLYHRLLDLGIRLYAKDDKLVWEAPKRAVTDDLLRELKAHKEGLLEILRIGKADRTRSLPLSYAQERLWFLIQLGYSEHYHMPEVVRLRGPLDADALQRALDHLVSRHESLRTHFQAEDGRPTQVVEASAAIGLDRYDLGDLPAIEQERETRSIVERLNLQPFDPGRAPLMRATLIRLEPELHVFGFCTHHIVSDGWSLAIVMREIGEAYAAYARGEEPAMKPLPVQYPDYAVWQRTLFTEDRLKKELGYWKERLAGYEDLDLPTDRSRPRQMSGRGGHVRVVLEREDVERIRKACQQMQVTVNTLLVASVYVLLQRYSGQQDICLGMPVANRDHWAVQDLIGFFVNTVVVRIRAGAEPNGGSWLQRVQQQIAEAADHQNVPFEKVVEALQPKRDLSRNPLFQVFVSYANVRRGGQPPLGDCRVEELALKYDVSKFDLGFFCSDEADGGLRISVEYSQDLYERDTAERMAGHLLKVMKGLSEEPDRADAPDLLTPEEREKVLVEWNGATAEYPTGKLIHELLEEQVARSPQAVAIRHEDAQLSYAELNAQANRLAHLLRRRGVGPEVCVAVCLERTPDLIAALLAVLKAGGVYVPVDPEYPTERLAFLLRDSQARMVITRDVLRRKLPDDVPASVLTLESLRPLLAQEASDNLGREANDRNAAYVIYTSGSTGQPKGVVIEHRSASTLLHWARDTFGSDGLASVLASTSVCFDLSVFEIFAPLAWGGTVVVVKNALELGAAAQRSPVGLVNTVPSVMAELLRQGDLPPSVHTVNLAGEPLSRSLVDQLYAQRSVQRVFDLYGPSEDTTYSTFVLRQPGAAPNIGRPITNTQAYVLDEHLRPVPVGVPGELYLGGAGLARGYLGRPELTAERFIRSPFVRGPGERLYRTGDLVRWRADGNIEYLGRKDQQVKVRGFRIELGEIEAALRELPGVDDAVVAVHEDADAGKRLVAYVVPRAAATLNGSELRRALERRLPQYMVPALFVTLPQLPLTPNGKVDRRALPDPGRPEAEQAFVPPGTPDEEVLASIWCHVLRRERVGIHDNFFDLGGHSLLVAQVIARAQDALHVHLPMRAFFEHPTVSGLARLARETERQKQASPPPALRAYPRDAELPLSLTEHDFWLACQMNPAMLAYNTGSAVRLGGHLDVAALEHSLNELVRRHEILRTTFGVKDGRPVRAIARPAPVSLETIDLRNVPDAGREDEARRVAAEQRSRPFDLTRGPLFRPTLVVLGEDDHVLALTMHHMISDAWSMGVLSRELGALYGARVNGEEADLSELPLQYADYAAWQREWLRGEVLDEAIAFWRKQLGGLTGRLPLPIDGPRTDSAPVRASSASLVVPRAEVEALKALSQRQGVTLFMALLAVFEWLLCRRSGRADIVVGVPSSERRRSELEGMLGVFLNVVVLRTDLGGEPSFLELLQRIRETCEVSYGRPGVSFGTVLQGVAPVLDLGRVSLNQVMFNFINVPEAKWDLGGLRAAPFGFLQAPPMNSELTLSLLDKADGLYCHLFYNGQLFSSASMTELLDGFRALVSQVVEAPDTRIGAYAVPFGTLGEAPAESKGLPTEPAGQA